MIKKIYILIFFCLFKIQAQPNIDNSRFNTIENQLDALSTEVVGLTETIKTDISVTNITLSNFLVAISEVHEININISTELNSTSIVNNFSNVTVKDLLVFLCKEYNLTIDFTGNILSIKTHIPEIKEPEKRIIPLSYIPSSELISIDARSDKLYDLFKLIIDETGKNLVFSPGLENKLLTIYLKDIPFESAMENLAFANDLYFEKTEDGFYAFESLIDESNPKNTSQIRSTRNKSGIKFELKDKDRQLLDVDFENTPVIDVVNQIGEALDIDVFTAQPLESAGNVSFKAKDIVFDELLVKIFESSGVEGADKFTFKKENNIYFFGTEKQLSVRKVAVIQMQHRSVELLSDPVGGLTSTRSAGRSTNFNNRGSFNQTNSFPQNRNREPINTNTNQNFNNFQNKVEALVNILPDEIKKDLDIKVDYELNSFYVNGPSTNIERFRNFINQIDKPVPVILIEVMLIEVSNTSLVETGVSWGIGNEPTTTQGGIYPETDLTLGANTINKVIGGFDGFGSFNLGKVVPNFFATIKAMESNGNLKVRSTPKLSTLNGHRARFSNGQTSYYAVTEQAVIGTDNPVTQTAINYVPIDAELGLTIKPLVSGDGQVTLDIFVVQSSFGARISEDAPPDISSREFSSIIRVKDQDIVVLGGLEEQMKNNSGSGVPFLARIPIIKWFFSKRKREAKKAKLTVLIKPTIIY